MESDLIRFIYNEELYFIEKTESRQKKVAVVVDESYNSQKKLLNNILNSVKLSAGDVELIQTTELLDIAKLSINTLIVFGVKLNIEIPDGYSIVRAGDKTILAAASLDVIANDATLEHKKKLWNLLKRHFN